MLLLSAILLFAQAQPAAGSAIPDLSSIRQQHLKELQEFSRNLTEMVLNNRVEALIPTLDYEVTVDLAREMRPADVARDLRQKGELYCRIFDTACAQRSNGPTFLSVKDIMLGRTSLPVIRFFQDFEEDLGFAYIEYMNAESSRLFGWRTSVMVEMEKVGGVWRIRALFPLDY